MSSESLICESDLFRLKSEPWSISLSLINNCKLVELYIWPLCKERNARQKYPESNCLCGLQILKLLLASTTISPEPQIHRHYLVGSFFFPDFILFIFLLYNIVLVLPYLNMNPPRVYTCSPSEPPSYLPPHTIPLGHPSAPAPNIQYHTLNLGW